MKKLEFIIGNLEGMPNEKSKYIIASNKNSLAWYSANLVDSEEPYHKQIAEYNNIPIQNVLGGGRFQVDNKTLKIWDYSGSFGGVPQEVANKFAEKLKQYLNGTRYNFKKTNVKPEQEYNNLKNEKQWRKLGFKVK